jgi:metalloendopeptidase OMA1, mitochondrial
MSTRISSVMRPANGGGPRKGLPPYVYGIGGGIVVLLGAGYFALLDEAPVTGRKRWIATNPEGERQLGDQEYRQLLKAFRNDILPPDHRASVTLNRVGRRIADAAFEFAQRNKIDSFTHNAPPFTYTVVRSDVANAFVLPGNHVFLMTGLFRYVQNEDELAVILGHECAHNLARHVGEKISGSLLTMTIARLSLLLDPSGLLFTLIVPAASIFRELPNSRTQEMEADRIGLQLTADACYDPRSAKRVFAAMKSDHEHSVKAPPEFLSTHPSHETRTKSFDDWLPEAMSRYDAERCSVIREQMQAARQAAYLEAMHRERKQSDW